jgi:hypothetical protein
MGLIQAISSLARRSPSPPPLNAVLDRIEDLVRRNRHLEALRYGLEHAARLDEVSLWLRLDHLRMESMVEITAASSARSDWPPQLDDPFPGAGSPPEVDARALDGEVLGGAIQNHGSLIVRNVLDATTCARLRDEIDTIWDACTAYYAKGLTEPEGTDYVPFPLPADAPLAHGRQWTQASGAVWAVEAPHTFENLISLYRRRGVMDAIAGYLGEQPVLSVGKTVLRRNDPNCGGDFHQDGAFMGADIRVVNVWIALSDCGVDAPGLEVVGRRLPELAPTGTEGAMFHWSVGRRMAEQVAAPASIVTPVFRAGDALVFDQLMLHSTYVTPAMTQRRYAIESWFFAPSSHAENQVPIVV